MFFSGLIGSLASGSMTAVWLVLMVVLLIGSGTGVDMVCAGRVRRDDIRHTARSAVAPDSLVLRCVDSVAGADKAACKEVCQLQGAADQRGHGDRQGVPCDGGY